MFVWEPNLKRWYLLTNSNIFETFFGVFNNIA